MAHDTTSRGADDPGVAETLARIGGVYYSAGQYDDKAVEVLQRALDIQEKRLPPKHPSLAATSFNLAAVYYNQGNYSKAELLFERALAIDEEALDPQHPVLAKRLVGLAEVLRLEGKYARADPLYERALSIQEKSLGSTHPEVATTLFARSLLRYATGKLDAAIDLMSRAAALREETLALVLTTGSEDQKRLFSPSPGRRDRHRRLAAPRRRSELAGGGTSRADEHPSTERTLDRCDGGSARLAPPPPQRPG